MLLLFCLGRSVQWTPFIAAAALDRGSSAAEQNLIRSTQVPVTTVTLSTRGASCRSRQRLRQWPTFSIIVVKETIWLCPYQKNLLQTEAMTPVDISHSATECWEQKTHSDLQSYASFILAMLLRKKKLQDSLLLQSQWMCSISGNHISVVFKSTELERVSTSLQPETHLKADAKLVCIKSQPRHNHNWRKRVSLRRS